MNTDKQYNSLLFYLSLYKIFNKYLCCSKQSATRHTTSRTLNPNCTVLRIIWKCGNNGNTVISIKNINIHIHSLHSKVLIFYGLEDFVVHTKSIFCLKSHAPLGKFYLLPLYICTYTYVAACMRCETCVCMCVQLFCPTLYALFL